MKPCLGDDKMFCLLYTKTREFLCTGHRLVQLAREMNEVVFSRSLKNFLFFISIFEKKLLVKVNILNSVKILSIR